MSSTSCSTSLSSGGFLSISGLTDLPPENGASVSIRLE
jgi:hypothetical protein